jgi:phenylalanyl-tRNA synthetase beta chain
VARGRVDTQPTEPKPGHVAFRPARVDRLLGTALGADGQREVLARVGIETAPAVKATEIVVGRPDGGQPEVLTAAAGEAILATVPTWRRDIEIEADLAEEVARVHGYEDVPSRLPTTTMPDWRESPLAARDAIREALVGASLTEAVTYALVSARHIESFGWTVADRVAAGEAGREGTPITVTNPLSQDHSILRQSLVGSLVDVVGGNVRHGTGNVAVFEVGKGYGRVGDAAREWWRLGLALAGAFEEPAWNRPRRDADIDDAKGAIELIARVLGSGAPAYEPLTDEPILHPGRSATVEARFGVGSSAGGKIAIAGVVGELHPRLVEAWDLRTRRVVVAELSVAGLTGGALPIVEATSLPHVMPVERDLTVDVPDSVAAAGVTRQIVTSAGPLLQDVQLVGTYRGQPLGPDERSLTFRLRFGETDRALADEEVDSSIRTITDALTDHIGARIRS